jgi:hypothetical protein
MIKWHKIDKTKNDVNVQRDAVIKDHGYVRMNQ